MGNELAHWMVSLCAAIHSHNASCLVVHQKKQLVRCRCMVHRGRIYSVSILLGVCFVLCTVVSTE